MKDNTVSLKRQTNLELLRIISMILIVMSHTDDWLGEACQSSFLNQCIADWLNMGGQIGVGCFLLISAYFMVDQKFTIRKFLRLAGDVWTYTLGIGIVFVSYILLHDNFRISFGSAVMLTIRSLFPIMFSHYWFVTAYVILMFFSPFLNKLIYSMDQNTYRKFLAIYIIISVVLDGGVFYALDGMADGRLFPILLMYFMGGYIKKFGCPQKLGAKKFLVIAFLGYILLYLSIVGIGFLGNWLDISQLVENRFFFRTLNSPFVFVINVALFLGFLKMPMKYNAIVNAIASATFGVYLIHANRIVSGYFLSRILVLVKAITPFALLIRSVLYVAIIFAGCVAIDLIRQKTIKKLWIEYVEKRLLKIITCFLSKFPFCV